MAAGNNCLLPESRKAFPRDGHVKGNLHDRDRFIQQEQGCMAAQLARQQ